MLVFLIFSDLVYFEWNLSVSSKSMSFEKSLTSNVGSGFDRDSWRSESLTRVRITNGTGFKTVVGNAVFTPGGKYYFVVRILKGSLIKIGITRSQENNEVVSLFANRVYRLSVTACKDGLYIMVRSDMEATHQVLNLANPSTRVTY